MLHTANTARDSETVEPAVLPPGTYWVGDPCYSIPSDRWAEWLEAAYAANHRHGTEVLLADLDGHAIVGVQTQHGDGSYTDRQGRTYEVDAGLIGLVPIVIGEERYPRSDEAGRLITFETAVEVFRCPRGAITLGHIVIDTDCSPWDD